jgi:hypothetical protein
MACPENGRIAFRYDPQPTSVVTIRVRADERRGRHAWHGPFGSKGLIMEGFHTTSHEFFILSKIQRRRSVGSSWRTELMAEVWGW